MLSPRWRKVVQDLWANKTRTILVVCSIALGVFAVGTIAGTQVMLKRDMTGRYLEVEPASATIGIPAFDEELVDMVRGIRGVGDAQGRRQFSARAKGQSGEWVSMQLFAVANFRDIRVNKIWPVRGEWPPSGRSIAIERQGVDLLGLTIGDRLVVETPEGKEKSLPITGVAHEVNQFPSKLSGVAYGYVTMDTLEWFGLTRNYNLLEIMVAENQGDEGHIREVVQRVQDKVEKSGHTVRFTYVPTPLEHPADAQVSPLLMLLAVLGFLSLMASGFLVVNTLSAVLTQQVRQIGIMKAIGATTGQVMQLYFVLVLGFGVLGLAVGAPLGVLGSRLFMNFLAGLINFDVTTYAIPPSVFALEVAVGLFVPLLASLMPIIRGARVSVREAVSDFGIKGANAPGLLDPILERLHFISRPMLLSLRNTFRARGRLALTLLTLTLAGSLFISVFSVRSSLLLTVDHVLAYWNYDVEVNFRQPVRMSELHELAMAVPGVTQAESWSWGSFTRVRPDGVESKRFSLLGIPPATEMILPTVVAGRWLLPGDENAIVINTDLRRAEKDLQVGDDLIMKIDGKESTWKVVGLVGGSISDALAYANTDQVQRMTGGYGRATNVHVQLDRHDRESQKAAATNLKEQFMAAGLRVGVIEAMYEIRERIALQFDLLVIFLLMMAMLLASVGGLGLMGTMSINVLERTREIGVIRAVGASNGAVLRLFLVEGMLIGVISWLISCSVALPLSRVLSHSVGILMLQVPLNYQFSIPGLLIWLAVVLIISALASLAPAWRASRLTVRDVLSYE